jgi:hypothetical protein
MADPSVSEFLTNEVGYKKGCITTDETRNTSGSFTMGWSEKDGYRCWWNKVGRRLYDILRYDRQYEMI